MLSYEVNNMMKNKNKKSMNIKVISTGIIGALISSTIFGGLAYNINKDLDTKQAQLNEQAVKATQLNESLTLVKEKISELKNQKENNSEVIKNLTKQKTAKIIAS